MLIYILTPAQPGYVHSAASEDNFLVIAVPLQLPHTPFARLSSLEFGGNMQAEIGLARLVAAKESTWGGLNMAPPAPSQAEKSSWSCSSQGLLTYSYLEILPDHIEQEQHRVRRVEYQVLPTCLTT